MKATIASAKEDSASRPGRRGGGGSGATIGGRFNSGSAGSSVSESGSASSGIAATAEARVADVDRGGPERDGSESTMVKLLKQRGQVALAPMAVCGARTFPTLQ